MECSLFFFFFLNSLSQGFLLITGMMGGWLCVWVCVLTCAVVAEPDRNSDDSTREYPAEPHSLASQKLLVSTSDLVAR